jgi:uncharacterized protein
MIKNLRKAIYQALNIKYWRKGQCKQCGQCCRTITLRFPFKLIDSEKEFELLKKWIPGFNHFKITDTADDGVLLFTCDCLTEDNRCSAYHFRSLFCRFYPHFGTQFIKLGGKPLEGCGYYYEPVVPFKEILDNTVIASEAKQSNLH